MALPPPRDVPTTPAINAPNIDALYDIQDSALKGTGAFSRVVIGTHRASGQPRAIKIMEKAGLVGKKAEMVAHEKEILRRTRHPAIIHLHECIQTPDRVYMIMDLMDGDLFDYIVKHKKLNERDSALIMHQLLSAVEYLHNNSVIHRDIKPENILMVDKELHVKLADFGLAKIIGEESFTTTLCGTPSYVAPEILAEGRHRKYTKAVDIWSLGVVLYICLCGFPPFSDELLSQSFPYTLSQQIKSGRFDYPSPYWDSVGDPALDLIDSMLIVDPERRFTIDQCLNHPWMTAGAPSVADSTDGLVGGIKGLDVQRRGVHRERTLLSSLNNVQVTARVAGGDTVKVFTKNIDKNADPRKEAGPAHNRAPGEFMQMGGKGDEELFANDGTSVYSKTDVTDKQKSKR